MVVNNLNILIVKNVVKTRCSKFKFKKILLED